MKCMETAMVHGMLGLCFKNKHHQFHNLQTILSHGCRVNIHVGHFIVIIVASIASRPSSTPPPSLPLPSPSTGDHKCFKLLSNLYVMFSFLLRAILRRRGQHENGLEARRKTLHYFNIHKHLVLLTVIMAKEWKRL